MLQKNHKIVISDRNFVIQDEVQDAAVNIQWEWTRLGGCGAFSFDLPMKYCTEVSLGSGFNVKIYWRDPITKSYVLRYQGRIEDKIQNVDSNGEVMTIQGMGYQSSLSDIFISNSYTSTEVSLIVKDILDNDIVPNTDISYTGTDIVSTGFTPSTWPIATDGLQAIGALSDLAGTREWVVDQNRKFKFLQRSSGVGFRFPFGGNVKVFNDDNTTKGIINRVIVIGGTLGDGSTYTKVFDDLPSQLKWKRRDSSVQNSSIISDDVATQFANALFAQYDDVSHSAQVDKLDDTQIESTIPIPLVELLPRLVTYDTTTYDSILYQDIVSYQVNRIQYTLDDCGIMSWSMQIGTLIPSIAEAVKGLEYNISQIQQQAIS